MIERIAGRVAEGSRDQKTAAGEPREQLCGTGRRFRIVARQMRESRGKLPSVYIYIYIYICIKERRGAFIQTRVGLCGMRAPALCRTRTGKLNGKWKDNNLHLEIGRAQRCVYRGRKINGGRNCADA